MVIRTDDQIGRTLERVNGLVKRCKDNQLGHSGVRSEEGIEAEKWEKRVDGVRGKGSGGQMERNPKMNAIF